MHELKALDTCEVLPGRRALARLAERQAYCDQFTNLCSQTVHQTRKRFSRVRRETGGLANGPPDSDPLVACGLCP